MYSSAQKQTKYYHFQKKYKNIKIFYQTFGKIQISCIFAL